MVKKLLALSIIATACSAQLVSVSSYIGKHEYNCNFGSAITGARVNDKLYTFGGCYPIPYVVDPNDNFYDYDYMRHNDKHTNVSDAIEIYDIPNDRWSTETEVKTPFPWRKAVTQTYNNSIYFYNILTASNIHTTVGMRNSDHSMWKYDTLNKKWTDLEKLPFVWIGSLAACQRDGKIYFTGTFDGQIRNIIQVYNAKSENWEKPIFLNKKILRVRQMLCGEDHIRFLGIEETEDTSFHYINEDNPLAETYTLISADYETGNTFSNGVNFTSVFEKVAVKDESFYVLGVESYNSTIFKIDTVTGEKHILGTSPHNLRNPLVVPYENDEVFLFGGGSEGNGRFCAMARGDDRDRMCNSIKMYNHKLVPEKEENGKLLLQD